MVSHTLVTWLVINSHYAQHNCLVGHEVKSCQKNHAACFPLQLTAVVSMRSHADSQARLVAAS